MFETFCSTLLFAGAMQTIAIQGDTTRIMHTEAYLLDPQQGGFVWHCNRLPPYMTLCPGKIVIQDPDVIFADGFEGDEVCK
jgi:hypothetical protein